MNRNIATKTKHLKLLSLQEQDFIQNIDITIEPRVARTKNGKKVLVYFCKDQNNKLRTKQIEYKEENMEKINYI
jgi:hypothetical protein